MPHIYPIWTRFTLMRLCEPSSVRQKNCEAILAENVAGRSLFCLDSNVAGTLRIAKQFSPSLRSKLFSSEAASGLDLAKGRRFPTVLH